MLNRVMVIGRLGKPVEVKYSQSGTAVASLTVATDESYTDKQGQRQSVTEWHRVIVYGKTAENCGQYLDKGSLVFVEGRLRTRKWTDRAGQERYTTEINADRVQFLDRRQDAQQAAPAQRQMPTQAQTTTNDGWDEVPF